VEARAVVLNQIHLCQLMLLQMGMADNYISDPTYMDCPLFSYKGSSKPRNPPMSYIWGWGIKLTSMVCF